MNHNAKPAPRRNRAGPWLVVGAFYLVLGLLFAIALGALTRATLDRIEGSERRDRVNAIVEASRAGGLLHLCIDGLRADRKEASRFTIVVPETDLERLTAGGIQGVELNYPRDRLVLSREQLREGCPALAVPVEYRRVSITADATIFVIPKLTTLTLEPQPATPGVVLVAMQDADGIVKQHQLVLALTPEGAGLPHYVLLAIEPRFVPGSRLWLLAIPLALVADALTFPIQLMMWVHYADSH